jgi:glycine cleavage system aminomethyltransferase T
MELTDAARASIGKLTSSAFSPLAGAWLALARVELEPLAQHEKELHCGPAGDPRWPARPTDPI